MKEFLEFEDIAEHINGYARVVQYEYGPRKDGKPGNQHKLVSLTEGRYQQGRIIGFAR